MKNDGGQYVRDESKHKKILKGFNFQITDSLLRIPYKHIVSTKNIDLLLCALNLYIYLLFAQ